MATTTCVNGQSVVHKTSEGIVVTSPDVCLTPVGNVVVPVPYTNTAQSQDTANGSESVLVDGNPIMLKGSIFSRSSGGEAGIAGVTSGTTCGEATFQNYSFDVKVEGRNVCRRLDPMTSNKGNTPPAALTQPTVDAKAEEGADYKNPLAVAFLYLHPDETADTTSTPIFETLHAITRPETHKHDSTGYAGALHPCEMPGGEYELTFDEFDQEEENFDQGQK